MSGIACFEESILTTELNAVHWAHTEFRELGKHKSTFSWVGEITQIYRSHAKCTYICGVSPHTYAPSFFLLQAQLSMTLLLKYACL
jgi:hypothetical protein